MDGLRVVRDLEEARSLWEAIMPREMITDLWEVRSSFHRHFSRPIHFLVEETGGRLSGLLPLSWVEEQGCYAFFPGETWKGRTWLEQNILTARDPERLLAAVPGPFHIRYLSNRSAALPANRTVDEIGYLFRPPHFGFEFDRFMGQFSSKSIKRIGREIEAIEAMGISWRQNRIEDFDSMVTMNVSRFGHDSYFSDPRFRRGFRDMVSFFDQQGWLRVTTVLIAGETAAVDIGVLYNGVYTLMAGGTSAFYPGIAKLINLHHMRRACEERMLEVDFLCGDFNWKKMFHLQERPLYLLAEAGVRAA
ncbi:MAG: GNAT family N-acetyltransferase [bacterium]|nr:MAG: GNAT family N-acetyltransferase [bacterium]